MSQRPFRDELRQAFDSMTEPAHPALAARIREQVGRTPSSAPRAPRLAMTIAAAVAVAVIAGLLVARYGVPWRTSGVPAGQPTATPFTAPSEAPTAAPQETPPGAPTPAAPGQAAPPAATPAPAASPGPGFSCANQTGGGTGSARVTAVRTGQQPGYDRFVIEFDGPVPRFEVRRQANATFIQDASGQPVTLQGSSGLLVVVRNASTFETYGGPKDLTPGYPVLREARLVGDFEGIVQWGLGLSKPACVRTAVLTGPARLVVDLQT